MNSAAPKKVNLPHAARGIICVRMDSKFLDAPIPDGDGMPSPEEMELGAAQTRTYLHHGCWFWLPAYEAMGEPQTYSSQHLSPYPIGHHLHTWPEPRREIIEQAKEEMFSAWGL